MLSKTSGWGLELNFGRAYLFYVHRPEGSYSFRVLVTANRPLERATGMTVNLTELDKTCQRLFKNTSSKNKDVIQLLHLKTRQLKLELEKIKTKLISVQFFEKRGFGLAFEGDKFYFIRSDFALDKKGNLVQVTSHFDSKNKLKRVRIVHEKDQLVEQIIY